MALFLTSRQLVWIKRGLDQLRQTAHYSVTSKQGPGADYYLLGDNQGSLELAKNPRINNRSKHIDIHYHFVRERLYLQRTILQTFSPSTYPSHDTMLALAESIRCNKRGAML